MSGRLDRYWLRISPVALFAGCGVFWFSDTIADPDLWGHVRFGQDIIRAGMIVTEDVYSYRTIGERWINHEWLSEVIFAAIYNLSGPRGLVVFKLLASMVLVGLSYVHLRRRGAGAYSPIFLLVLSSIPYRLGLGTIRPQIFTYACFLFELLVLEKASRGRTRWLWLMPALFAIWTNLHGGVLAGVGVLVIWIVARIAAVTRSGAMALDRGWD